MTDLAHWVPLPPHMWPPERFRLEMRRLAERGEIAEAHALAEAYAKHSQIQDVKEGVTK